jgi:hypothetical protein
MPNRNDSLNEKTFKNQIEELDKRVFYTLTSEETLQAHQVAKALSILVKLLHDKNILSDNEIDELLLEVVL